eukprot:1158879-Pelagomonas_calceolata.AAC.2
MRVSRRRHCARPGACRPAAAATVAGLGCWHAAILAWSLCASGPVSLTLPSTTNALTPTPAAAAAATAAATGQRKQPSALRVPFPPTRGAAAASATTTAAAARPGRRRGARHERCVFHGWRSCHRRSDAAASAPKRAGGCGACVSPFRRCHQGVTRHMPLSRNHKAYASSSCLHGLLGLQHELCPCLDG